MRAARRARTVIVGGVVATALSLVVVAFLFLVPPDSGRDYPALILMAGFAVAGAVMAAQGRKTLRLIGKDGPG